LATTTIKEDTQLLVTREVAAKLRCTPATVRELVNGGRLRPIRLSPKGHLRFRLEDVERLIAGEKPDE
jgi:excisionase family DNA binding protein